ncbi:MAG TPA: winged helix-turn-helix domain-containing protein, partial [Candidatus Angelobacter sp.]|nr:winged helix-turn-helix domain-containing protein [Candidatus Angelobacter sp.]
ALLLREPGRVFTRDELRQELWQVDTFVDFERGISTAVNKLREALGDSASNPRFIETVGRRGYRFIAPVTLVASGSPRAPVEAANGLSPSQATGVQLAPAKATPAKESSGRPLRYRWTLLSLAVLLGLAAIAVAIVRFSRSGDESTQPIRSIAVLPLQNLSGDPQQEYLSDGLTDAITTDLAQIPELRVISRTTSMHYKQSQKTTPEIARELGVDALVEGSVMRSGTQLRLNIQLIQTRNERHLWANSYDRELANALTLQGELAREIAGQIKLRLTPEQEERLAKSQRVDPETYILYLQGRFYWQQRSEASLTKAIGYFEQAVARDPNFAQAYAGLADACLVLPFFSPISADPLYAKARDAADKALALDPRLAEAHNSEAYVKLYHDWDFKGAEQEFLKALALNPNYATAHQWYAELLSFEGRHEEAITQVTRALLLDAQSAVVHHQAGQVFRSARQHSKAMAEYERSLQLDPQLWANYFTIYRIYRGNGDYEKALDALQKHANLGNPAYRKAVAEAVHAFHQYGRDAFLRKSLQTWTATGWPVTRYYEAWDYAALGDSDKSIQVLEREYARHNLLLLDAKTDQELDSLRSDPRFQALLVKIGLP